MFLKEHYRSDIVFNYFAVYCFLQAQLQENDGDNPLMHKVFDLYLLFPQTTQSETVQKHAFAVLRTFISKVFLCMLLVFVFSIPVEISGFTVMIILQAKVESLNYMLLSLNRIMRVGLKCHHNLSAILSDGTILLIFVFPGIHTDYLFM